jgi:hypothetical protein
VKIPVAKYYENVVSHSFIHLRQVGQEFQKLMSADEDSVGLKVLHQIYLIGLLNHPEGE